MDYHLFRMTAISAAYPIQTPTHHLYECSFLFLVELVPTHTGKDTKKIKKNKNVLGDTRSGNAGG